MEQILYSISEYKILAAIVGFFVMAVETFIPVIPLMALILANVFILGMWIGFLVSWLGSSVGSILLYYLAAKFSKISLFKRYKEKDQTKKIIKWIKKQGFSMIFISYVCPFIPDFLITIASGFTEVDIKTFSLGMVIGKFVMFLLISYVGEDISEFFTNPIKIIVFTLAISISWMIGKSVNKKINHVDI